MLTQNNPQAYPAADADRARDASAPDRAVQAWLLLVAGLVALMIVVGGATRLTDSGLSITEWQPIMGALPPLSDADWQEAFAKYRQIPEFQLVNKTMSLEGFKFIFWWEWAHRLLGRVIGATFALPLVYFWFSGALRPGLIAKLMGLLALGALQGAAGWYMVKSGLVDRVDVSQYRLALHLGLAFLILGLLLWLALDLGKEPDRAPGMTAGAGRQRLAGAVVVLVFLQVLLGALVAGLDAGLAYNTWPLMDGALVPGGLGALTPWYLNLFDNVTTVQFNHRVAAYAVTALAVWQAWDARGAAEPLRASAALLAAAVIAQVALGVAALVAALPLPLALAHQAGAALVFALAVRHLHRTMRALV
jgi:cytochrome c oxidase assembly protein subunit 15